MTKLTSLKGEPRLGSKTGVFIWVLTYLFFLNGLGQTSVHRVHEWSNRLDELIPGMTVNEPKSFGEAIEVIDEADSAYGNVSPG